MEALRQDWLREIYIWPRGHLGLPGGVIGDDDLTG